MAAFEGHHAGNLWMIVLIFLVKMGRGGRVN
jgi:hypothetical protein